MTTALDTIRELASLTSSPPHRDALRQLLAVADAAVIARYSRYDRTVALSEAVRAMLEEAPVEPANPHDWPEDRTAENGNYQCRCDVCGETFMGHKRRVICKVCWRQLKEDEPPAPPAGGRDGQ